MEDPSLGQNSLITPDNNDPALPPLDSVEWSASEYIAHQKNVTWFMGLGAAAAVVLVVIFVVTHSIVSTLVVTFAFAALGMYSVRQPDTKKYRITEEGVFIDDKYFTFGSFKSFSVVEEDAAGCVWLRPIRKYIPTVAMYYPPAEEDRIINMLENFLPIEDRSHDVMDRISRKMRF